MSINELKIDQANTYEALVRLINVGRTSSPSFLKLTERLAWVNKTLVQMGGMSSEMDDAASIREAWGV